MRLVTAVACAVGVLSSLAAAAPIGDSQLPVAWQGSQERRLISTSETESKWMTEDEVSRIGELVHETELPYSMLAFRFSALFALEGNSST